MRLLTWRRIDDLGAETGSPPLAKFNNERDNPDLSTGAVERRDIRNASEPARRTMPATPQTRRHALPVRALGELMSPSAASQQPKHSLPLPSALPPGIVLHCLDDALYNTPLLKRQLPMNGHTHAKTVRRRSPEGFYLRRGDPAPSVIHTPNPVSI